MVFQCALERIDGAFDLAREHTGTDKGQHGCGFHGASIPPVTIAG
jgi:hypothetical protein